MLTLETWVQAHFHLLIWDFLASVSWTKRQDSSESCCILYKHSACYHCWKSPRLHVCYRAWPGVDRAEVGKRSPDSGPRSPVSASSFPQELSLCVATPLRALKFVANKMKWKVVIVKLMPFFGRVWEDGNTTGWALKTFTRANIHNFWHSWKLTVVYACGRQHTEGQRRRGSCIFWSCCGAGQSMQCFPGSWSGECTNCDVG